MASIQYVLSKLSTQARLETSLYHNSFNDKQTPFSFGGLGSFFVCVEVLHLLACPMCGVVFFSRLVLRISTQITRLRSQELEMRRGALGFDLGRDMAWMKNCPLPGFHNSMLQSLLRKITKLRLICL